MLRPPLPFPRQQDLHKRTHPARSSPPSRRGSRRTSSAAGSGWRCILGRSRWRSTPNGRRRRRGPGTNQLCESSPNWGAPNWATKGHRAPPWSWPPFANCFLVCVTEIERNCGLISGCGSFDGWRCPFLYITFGQATFFLARCDRAAVVWISTPPPWARLMQIGRVVKNIEREKTERVLDLTVGVGWCCALMIDADFVSQWSGADWTFRSDLTAPTWFATCEAK